MRGKSHEVDMIHGPLSGKIVRFALPLMASSILQQLFNAADVAVVGRFASAAAMAAVGSNSSVISLLVSLFVGMAVGANVVIGILLGGGERKEIGNAVHTIIGMAFAAGLLILGIGILAAGPILTVMGAPEDVRSLAIIYLRIYFLGMPAIMVYNYGSAILRSRGDSSRPFYSLTAAGVLNVLLNLLFVVVFKLHVIGVALATVISNYLSGALTLAFLLKEEGEFRLRLRDIPTRFRKSHLKNVVRVGLPAGLQGMVFGLSNVVIQSQINSFGADCIAGNTAAQNFEFISYFVLTGFSQAAVSFVSQNYGARQPERCRRSLRLCLLWGIGLDLIVIALCEIFKIPLIRVFTTDEAVIPFAVKRFERVILFHFLCGTYEITGGALRGLNRSMVPALISVLGTCAFRLLYVGTWFPTHRSLENLLQIYPLSWILTGIAMNTAYIIIRNRLFFGNTIRDLRA